MNIELSFHHSPPALSQAAARRWIALLLERNQAETYGVLLSGGRLASAFFDAVVAEAQATPVSWEEIHFFWADERCVAPSDPENNYRIALEHLFQPLSIPTENIHRIYGEMEDDYAVQQAEAEICRLLPLNENGQPIVDIAFLGMGEDGHTASLFPTEPLSMVSDNRVFRVVFATKPPPKRVTIGYQPLIGAKEAWVLVAGAAKKEALEGVLEGELRYPLGRIATERRKTVIFNDIVQP
jgi:6-phosphogluconolactonase